MELRSYPDVTGFMKDGSMLVHGPIEPGTLLTKVPMVADMQLRFGVIVGVHGSGSARQTDVMWNPWLRCPGIIRGDLRMFLGIPTAAERAETKRRQKRARSAQRKRRHDRETEGRERQADDHS